MKRIFLGTITALTASRMLLASAYAGWSPKEKDQPTSAQEVDDTIVQFLQSDKGLQAGAQAYSELIFFGEKAALDRFIRQKAEFSAQVSAVAATTGASADADYSNGVAVFTLARRGADVRSIRGRPDF